MQKDTDELKFYHMPVQGRGKHRKQRAGQKAAKQRHRILRNRLAKKARSVQHAK